VRLVKDCALALLLAAAISLSGTFLSGQALESVRESALYRRSQIIGSIFSRQDAGITEIALSPRARGLLLKFAGALADAYVNFEMIPHSELTTFTVVYESLGPLVEIESFTYRRKDLIITGRAPDENGYQEFMERLRSRDYFGQVTGGFYTNVDSGVRFEIQCAAPV